ncbi:MAG TPA: hypothetical protein VMZ31_08900 [Phycisphaerae bacterium]|nr:hypothetical protein [Phycisphaerae bacterium]
MQIGGPGQRRTAVAVCRFEKGVRYLQISFDTDNAISTFYLHSRSPVAAPTAKSEPSEPSAGREVEMGLGGWACLAAAGALPLCVFLALSRRGQGTIAADSGGKTLAERVGTPTLIVLALYSTSVVAGAITYQIGGQDVAASVQESDDQIAALESTFGAYRAPIRDGVPSAILTVVAIVFATNLCTNVLNFTAPGALILPLGFLLFAGWNQGVSIASLTASSAGSLLGFLAVLGLESGTYVLAAAAGLNAGLSFLMPARQGARSRWRGFGRGWRDALRFYAVIVGTLAAQALLEVMYVRQVLLAGGTGIPLRPY